MTRRIGIATVVTTIMAFGSAGTARAGDYYVYSCSSYGNTAPVFAPYSNADHLSTANGCMQPAPGGGYRSLEINNPPNAPVLHGYGANWTAHSPSPAISIVGAYTPPNTVFVDCNLHTDGFTAEYLWSTGTQDINHVNACDSSGYGYGTGINMSFAPSSYFGWGAGCWLASQCATSSSVGAVLGVQGVRLTVQENTGPSVFADGANNLWYQGGRWVRGGGWPVTFTASDPSGVCGTDLLINGQFTATDNTNDGSPNSASFTQCWPADTPTGTLDTRGFTNGSLSIMYAANNAAGVVSNPSENVQIDNTPVTLSLASPNDSDPNLWVNHSVKVIATATAGPSGLSATNCSTNSGASHAYPSGGVTLDGTGVWTIMCTSQNHAVDVNGQVGSSPKESLRIRIDETPPTVKLEPPNPADPQAVVASANDAQSGVASGQIEIRPAGGGTWNPLGTHLDGSHLVARLNDAALAPGPWAVQASSCDYAGNCASSQEILILPLRAASLSSVGFGKVRYSVQACSIRRAGRRHPKRVARRCRSERRVQTTQKNVSFGKPVLVHGTLTTAQGVPLVNARVTIRTAPDNGLGQYRRAASATTDSNGFWSARLPAGPSRLISAVYAGSSRVQPSAGRAKLLVPAAVRVLRVWPRHVPWGGEVHIRARLLGGFLPPGGALVRLRLGYGSAKITYGVREHVGGNGTFDVTNIFGPGPPTLVRHYWLQECTLPEGDYPFAPACGPRSNVTVGF